MTDTSPDSLQPVPKAITIFINGEPLRRNAPSDLALIDLLHEDLGLTGAKFGCGIGVCRACTVLARRTQASLAEPLLACSTPAVALDGYWLETIEGVAGPDGLSPVQTAFLNHFAFQCGYCTPGFVMATLILLERLRAAPSRPRVSTPRSKKPWEGIFADVLVTPDIMRRSAI